jgi:transposase
VRREDLEHRKLRIGPLPIINACIDRLGLRELLRETLGNERYADAIELLIKNVLIEPAALYRISGWASHMDPEELRAGPLSDDVLGRSLDKLFGADRATFQTQVTLAAITRYNVDVSQIHNDSTSVKVHGEYKRQSNKAINLKRGHSKDHRPDLKQLLYNLSIARDGAVPIHFKTHDGNKTDDRLHIENWLALRSLVGTSTFLYVADSKLCTRENMMRIDREQGRFVTVVPKTRRETVQFGEECYQATVRWKRLTRRRSTRRHREYDVFSIPTESYQLEEGFRVYWYRSSEKKKRDAASRKERIESASRKLAELNERRGRGRTTEAALRRRAGKILDRHRASSWFSVTIKHRQEEEFTKTTRGKPSSESMYRRTVKRVPYLVVKLNEEAIARAKAIDGVFPLTTNTSLTAKEALEAYKYQPYIEKRFATTKSDLYVAPLFFKKNERIEAIMLVVYLADLVAALIQRELRLAMKQHGVQALRTLPEERPSKAPTWEQIQRLFANHCKYQVLRGEKVLRTFWDDLSEEQVQVLTLLGIPLHRFTGPGTAA